MNIKSSLTAELRDKSYRDAYVASQIRIGLPFQIRALRIARDWTQGELAKRAGMSQPRIAEIEKGKRSLNLETLLRLASAFDIGLDVFFTSFGDLVKRRESFDPDSFDAVPFEKEILGTEQRMKAAEKAAASTKRVIASYTYTITTSAQAVASGTFLGGLGISTAGPLNPGDAVAFTLTTSGEPSSLVLDAENQAPVESVYQLKDVA